MSDFQASSSRQGKAFEEAVATLLKINGWKVVSERIKVHHSEIDIVAEAPDGRVWWIECKGSWGKRQGGASSSDTAKKALGVAWYLSLQDERQPYMLVTSHLPNADTATGHLLAEAKRVGLFNEVFDLANFIAFLKPS